MQPVQYTLENGLRVIFIDTKAFPTLTTLLLIGAGSRFENEKNNGIAHFFEHMAFKGSKKYPSSFIISSTIEQLGGVFNAFTAKDHTGYWIKGITSDFETIIDVLSDMIISPLLDAAEIEREKGVIAEEINMYEDTPYRKVGELYEGLLYKGSSLGFDIAGTKQIIATFNRKTFVDYMNKLYHPQNAVLVVAGGFGGKKKFHNFLKEIKARFANWKPAVKTVVSGIRENQKSPQLLVHYKKTEQAHLCLGFRTFSFFDERKYALSVLATILGGGMSSRLFMEVREKRGLCYYISTGRELYHDVGNMVTQAGITNDIKKVKEAIKVTINEHNKILQGKISQEEIDKAKESIKGRLFLSMEDSFNVASFYGNKKLLEERIESPDAIIKEIEEVTREEIVLLAKDFFRYDKLNAAIIGPFKQEEFEGVLSI